MALKNSKIIIIGGITWRETRHPRLGGTTVLMDNFIDYCKAHNVPHVVIPTNKYYEQLAGLKNLMVMLGGFFKNAKRGDVAMVNISSSSGIITLFPLVVVLSQLFGLQVVCRKFAGSVHHYLDAKSYRKKIAFFFLKKTKVSFFETNDLIAWFENNGYHAQWFPNVRERNPYVVSEKYEKRLIFLAQVYEDKGVDILLRLSNRLPEDYQIDIYGPITDKKYTKEYFKPYRAQYRGSLKPDEVPKTLAQYNLMVFPTWWHSEGYPGVIIEAFSVGLPVVSTFQGGIPELVEDGKSGLLVAVKDEVSFEQAVLSVDQTKYCELRNGALQRFNVYDSELVNPKVVSMIMD